MTRQAYIVVGEPLIKLSFAVWFPRAQVFATQRLFEKLEMGSTLGGHFVHVVRRISKRLESLIQRKGSDTSEVDEVLDG